MLTGAKECQIITLGLGLSEMDFFTPSALSLALMTKINHTVNLKYLKRKHLIKN